MGKSMGPPGPRANSARLIFSASERLTLAVFVDAGIEFGAAVLAHELKNLRLVRLGRAEGWTSVYDLRNC